MQETLKMMKGIITGKEMERDEKELIKEYKEYLSPNILAYFYYNNFRLIYIISESYNFISSEDKASFCLQELDKCLRNYNLESNVKFMTYFSRCYKNRLRMETENNMLNINRANILSYSMDILDEKSYEQDLENIEMVLDNYKLDKKEKRYCRLASDGYSIKEMSKLLKISTISLYRWQKSVKKKILNQVINFA